MNFPLSKNNILEQMARLVSEGSGWTIDSINNHYMNVVKYQPVNGSSYIPLPKELRHSRKGLINMKIMIMNAVDGAIFDI